MFEFLNMLPSQENDSTPKAPDKSVDKTRNDGQENVQKECSAADGDNKLDIESKTTLDHDLYNVNDTEGDYNRLSTKYQKNSIRLESYVNTSTYTEPTLEKPPRIIKNDYPKNVDYEAFTKLNGTFPVFSCRRDDEKDVDENCNALGVGSKKKKKIKKRPVEKNVNVCFAESISGHRSDIINDVDKLTDFIDGNDNVLGGQKIKSGMQKSQKIHKKISDEGKTDRKQRTMSRGKGCNNLQKNNSVKEISTTTSEDFEVLQEEVKVASKQTKSNTDKSRERRSCENSEQIQVQSFHNVSTENLETSGFSVVTKKKKSKKRRSPLSNRMQTSSKEEYVGSEPRRHIDPFNSAEYSTKFK